MRNFLITILTFFTLVGIAQTKDKITIKTKEKIYVNIYDIVGNNIANKQSIQKEGQIDLSNY